MKKSILLLINILFCFSNILVAQDDNSDSMKKQRFHEFGINVTTFINQFASLNNNDADLGDYMITYKYHMGKNAIRFGLGGQFSQIDEPAGGGNRVTKANNFDVRLGYEWNKFITKKWSFYYGFDAIVGNSQSITIANNAEEITTTEKTNYYGGGALIGVQFFLNSHISLATESSLYYRHEKVTDKAEFSLTTDLNTNDVKTNDFADFGLPTALFFVIRF